MTVASGVANRDCCGALLFFQVLILRKHTTRKKTTSTRKAMASLVDNNFCYYISPSLTTLHNTHM